MNKNKHLTLDDRYIIQHSVEERMSFKAIGTLLGKDCTTIAKEIKGHMIFETPAVKKQHMFTSTTIFLMHVTLTCHV